MPPDLPEPGEVTRRLVSRRAQRVVYDLQAPITQVEDPGDRHPLPPALPNLRLESVLPVRRGFWERHRRAGIDGDETAARPHGPSEPIVHHLELPAVARIVEQVGRHHQVEL